MSISFQEPALPPWSFKRTIGYLLKSSLSTEYYGLGSSVRRVLRLKDEDFLVEFSSPKNGILQTTIFGDPDEYQVEEARRIARRTFSLDQPLKETYRMMSKYGPLDKLRSRFNGLRIIQTPTIWEMAATAIIGQQLNLAFTKKVKRRLVDYCGKQLRYEGRDYLGFPAAETISQLSTHTLRTMQFSRFKAEYLLEFAQAISTGKIDEATLRMNSDEQIYDELSQYRGIGRWTVDMVLMRALGRPDVLPSLDVALQAAHGLVFNRERPTSRELLRLTSNWTGFRSYATFYLWAFLSAERPIRARIFPKRKD